MEEFTIEYKLREHGWATIKFENLQAGCESAVSYLHDSLAQLADMALELRRGAPSAKAIFMDEPGELQFVVEVKNNQAAFEVRQFQDWESWGMHPANDYKVLLSGSCQPSRIIHQISNLLWKIHEEIGPDEYKKRWIKHEFPLEKYKSLLEE